MCYNIFCYMDGIPFTEIYPRSVLYMEKSSQSGPSVFESWIVHSQCIYLFVHHLQTLSFFLAIYYYHTFSFWLFVNSYTNSPEVYLLERSLPFLFSPLPNSPIILSRNNELQLTAGCAFFQMVCMHSVFLK